MPRGVIAVMSLVVLVAVAAYGFQAAAADVGTDRTIDGESFTPDPGVVTTLDHSNLANTYYDETVTVYDSNGDRVDPGADYVWFEANGTIKTVQGGALDGQSSATINYGYQTTTADQRALIGLVGTLPNVLGAILPIFGVVIVLLFLKS